MKKLIILTMVLFVVTACSSTGTGKGTNSINVWCRFFRILKFCNQGFYKTKRR